MLVSMRSGDALERVRVMQTRRLKDASFNTPKKVETVGIEPTSAIA
jgi:hypothetical protein